MRERKFRFALNLIGILIGCAAISSLVSITQGMNEEIRGQLEIFGPTNIMIIPGQIQPGRGLLSTSLNWRDLDLISKIPHVDVATPIIGDKFCTVNVRGREIQTFVYGVQPEYFQVFKNYEIEEGRAIIRSDNAVAVLGSLVAKPRGEDEPLVEVSDRIQLQVVVAGEERSMSFRVVGILKEIGGTFGSEDDNAITIPYRMCQQLFEIGGEIEYIATMVDAVEEVDGVVERIEEVFDESVMVMSFDTIRNLVGDVLGTIEAVLAGIATISLVVAGVGIINTMTISVMERTREIGILKAIGAKKKDVMLMFLSETILTGLVGGVTGVILGMILGRAVGNYINLPVYFSSLLGIAVIGFAVVTCIVSGLYPAWKAASMNPIDALRTE